MKPVITLLTSRWFISFVGIALSAALVWVFAPLLPRFEDPLIRLSERMVRHAKQHTTEGEPARQLAY